MKKVNSVIAIATMSALMLCGCGGGAQVKANSQPTGSESEAASANNQNEMQVFEQTGPYGTVKVSIPTDYDWSVQPLGEAETGDSGTYGFNLVPASESEGFIELMFRPFFGVCGTGLVTEEKTLAGSPATFGYYDGNENWNYIVFSGDNEKLSAQSVITDSWTDKSREEALLILDKVSFDPDLRSGNVYVFSPESELIDMGLSLNLKDIKNTGATLVFNQWDILFEGELSFGDDFTLSRKSGETWEEVPVTLEGDYAFNSIAYIIPNGDITEKPMDWSWLYGELTPGEYRITKTIINFKGPGNNEFYEICGDFIIN